jgi:hypothetical protein
MSDVLTIRALQEWKESAEKGQAIQPQAALLLIGEIEQLRERLRLETDCSDILDESDQAMEFMRADWAFYQLPSGYHPEQDKTGNVYAKLFRLCRCPPLGEPPVDK